MFVFVFVFAPTVQAHAPIQWMSSSTRGLVLMPKGFAGHYEGVVPPHQLAIGDVGERVAPSFTAKFDKTISLDGMGWCLEADGDKSGNAVRVNYCTAGPFQKWKWVPNGHGKNMIQLEDSSLCIDVVGVEHGSNEASIQLQECDRITTVAWKFEQPALQALRHPSDHGASHHLRCSMIFLIALVGVGMLTLIAWFSRRKATAQMVPANQGAAPLNVDQESGVSLTIHGCSFRVDSANSAVWRMPTRCGAILMSQKANYQASWGDRAGSVVGPGVTCVIPKWKQWAPWSARPMWLLIGGAMDPPGDIATSLRPRDSQFLQGVAKDIHNMQRAVGSDLFKILFGTDATVAEVKKRIGSLMEVCKENHRMPAIYYTGHGEFGTGNWCFADGKLAFEDIVDLHLEGVHHPVVFVDACYSGHWANTARDPQWCSYTVIAASPHFMTTNDWGIDEGGEFTAYITGNVKRRKQSPIPIMYSRRSLKKHPLPESVRTYPYKDRLEGELVDGRILLAQHLYKEKACISVGHVADFAEAKVSCCIQSSERDLRKWGSSHRADDMYIASVSCGNSYIGAVAVEMFGTEQFLHTTSVSPDRWIASTWSSSCSITSVSPGLEKTWIIVMTRSPRHHLFRGNPCQSYLISSSWKQVEAFISEGWNDGFMITDIARSGGEYFCVMTKGNEAQEYVWCADGETVPVIRTWKKKDFYITSMMKKGRKWMLVATGGLNVENAEFVSGITAF